MTQKIKDYLGIVIIVAVAILSVSVWSAVRTYSRSVEPSSFRSFSVSAEGKAVAIPDLAEFSFSVVSQGGVGIAKLQADNTTKTNEAITFVKSRGVAAGDVKTQNYSIEPRYQYYSCPVREGTVQPCPPPEIVGYTITQTVLVKIRDFAKIGDILSGVVEAGANNVSQLNFTLDDPTAVQDEARAEAITKAKEKARSIAKAAGFGLGRLISISESGFAPIPFYLKEAGGGDIRSLSAAPVIEPGSQEVAVGIILTYEIK